MKSLISILWQHETKSIKITPTITKSSTQPPNFYFYSDKQRRVLRKKQVSNHTAFIEELLLKQMGIQAQSQLQKQPKTKKYILRINKKAEQHVIDFSIVEISECLTKLYNDPYEGQFCLIEQENSLVRFQMRISKQKTQESKIFESFPFLQNQNSFVIKLQVWCKKFVKDVYQSLVKKSKSRIKFPSISQILVDVDLILSIPSSLSAGNSSKIENLDEIKLVEGIKFILQSNDQKIDEIGLVSPNFQNVCSSQFSQIQIKKLVAQEKKEQQITSNFQQPQSNIDNCKTCKGCQSEFNQVEAKQVEVEFIKQLRKHHGLSLRGLNEEYYQVCRVCYMFQQ